MKLLKGYKMDPLWTVVVPRQLVLYFERCGKESLETC